MQNTKIVDLSKSYVPGDPNVFPENLEYTAQEDAPEKADPILAYEGVNFLPTEYGYRSYFGEQATINIAGLTSRCSELLMFQGENYSNLLVALCEDGIWTSSPAAVAGAWTPVVTIVFNPLVYKDWTYILLSGSMYFYQEGNASVDVLAPALTWTNFVPSFLHMAGQKGIFRAGGRLGFWDSANSVSYSSPLDYTDLTPALTTGAGNTKFRDVVGNIVLILSHGDGFIIYSTKSIVGVHLSQSTQALWSAAVVSSITGIAYPTHVCTGTSDSQHFVYTPVGLYSVGSYSLSEQTHDFTPLLTSTIDFVKESELPIRLTCLEGRYLFLSLVDGKYIDSAVSSRTVTTPGLMQGLLGWDGVPASLPTSLTSNQGTALINGLLAPASSGSFADVDWDGTYSAVIDFNNSSSVGSLFTAADPARHWGVAATYAPLKDTASRLSFLNPATKTVAGAFNTVDKDKTDFIAAQAAWVAAKKLEVVGPTRYTGTATSSLYPELPANPAPTNTYLGTVITGAGVDLLEHTDAGTLMNSINLRRYFTGGQEITEVKTIEYVGYDDSSNMREYTTPMSESTNFTSFGVGLLFLRRVGSSTEVVYTEDGITFVVKSIVPAVVVQLHCVNNRLFIGHTPADVWYQLCCIVLLTSTDGITWTTCDVPLGYIFFGDCPIAYGAGQYAAIASDGTETRQVLLSADGITFTSHPLTNPSYGNLSVVAIMPYGGGLVAVDQTQLSYSADGVNWAVPTPISHMISAYRDCGIVQLSSGLYAAMPDSSRGIQGILVSADMITWTPKVIPIAYGVFPSGKITSYGDTIYVYKQQSGILASSSDGGTTWVVEYTCYSPDNGVGMVGARVGCYNYDISSFVLVGTQAKLIESSTLTYTSAPVTGEYGYSNLRIEATEFNKYQKDASGKWTLTDIMAAGGGAPPALNLTYPIGLSGSVVFGSSSFPSPFFSETGYGYGEAPISLGNPAILPVDPLIISYPPVSYNLIDGSPAPLYPTYLGALVLDIQLKKWGKYKGSHSLIFDYSPQNNTLNGSIPYSNFGMRAGALRATGTVSLFDSAPVESWIRYGKVGYYRQGMTQLQEVRAHFRGLSTGMITLETSLDGRNLEASLQNGTVFTTQNSVTAYNDYNGSWHTIKISGQWDLQYLEVRGNIRGRR